MVLKNIFNHSHIYINIIILVIKSQIHDLDLILDECIERVKYGKTYRSSKFSKLLPKSTFNKIYLDLQSAQIKTLHL